MPSNPILCARDWVFVFVCVWICVFVGVGVGVGVCVVCVCGVRACVYVCICVCVWWALREVQEEEVCLPITLAACAVEPYFVCA